MSNPNPPAPHLDPSELGTKSYWDAAYSTEIQNFTSNADDEGMVWFSDAGAEERMVQFLEDLAEEGGLRKGDEDEEDEGDGEGDKPSSFLDLGTGNGHLLFSLRDSDFTGPLVGIDYSSSSISLAKQILATKPSPYSSIQFHEWDILTQTPGPWVPNGGFDVVLDKGTFDAISLSEEKDERGRRVCEGYAERVAGLVAKGGRCLITSCNWTEEELRGWFEGEGKGGWVFEDRVKYSTFRFGGREGSSVVTVCFRRTGDGIEE
ncbi:S-adenosyl-L-methionine-dependent methyltransferase [Dendryphion nanum]|uniref:Protein-lysine N-methyltransferase EFM4 n=1 Tax=Dendryphion nanum TaxID=256645 RepID=A0A9P9EEB2_9PLEO|nr:S-adenosyl-L-methionine-dependent methyltransferase [Dendryphion nanum]